MKNDTIIYKLKILFGSILLCSLYFLFCLIDDMLITKNEILIALIVDTYLFFIIPTIRLFGLKDRRLNIEYLKNNGSLLIERKLLLHILFSPFYGIVYYFNLTK